MQAIKRILSNGVLNILGSKRAYTVIGLIIVGIVGIDKFTMGCLTSLGLVYIISETIIKLKNKE